MSNKTTEIQRVNTYADPRFSARVLQQHGAFLVNGVPCEVEIVNKDSAVIRGCRESEVLALIREFRFYAEHITRFTTDDGKLLMEFPYIPCFRVELKKIQPSQFYVDTQKLEAVGSFVVEPEDIVIPLIETDDGYISLDGHTRLALAVRKQFSYILGFLTEADFDVYSFVEEARKREIFTPYDLKIVSHVEYEVLWNEFCDDFMSDKSDD